MEWLKCETESGPFGLWSCLVCLWFSFFVFHFVPCLSDWIGYYLLVFARCSIDVVSSAFEGQSAVNRQRMVYKAIWEELQSTVHAVDQMTTKTPKEAVADQWKPKIEVKLPSMHLLSASCIETVVIFVRYARAVIFWEIANPYLISATWICCMFFCSLVSVEFDLYTNFSYVMVLSLRIDTLMHWVTGLSFPYVL